MSCLSSSSTAIGERVVDFRKPWKEASKKAHIRGRLYRLALLKGVRNIRTGGWSEDVPNRVVLGQLKSMIQFHDFALDQLRALRGH